MVLLLPSIIWYFLSTLSSYNQYICPFLLLRFRGFAPIWTRRGGAFWRRWTKEIIGKIKSRCFLFFKKMPLHFVLLSNGICSGNWLLVFVIGHTTANLVLIKNCSLLIITPGLLSAFSCPDCGLKSKNTISPCFGLYITTLPFQQENPSQIPPLHILHHNL